MIDEAWTKGGIAVADDDCDLNDVLSRLEDLTDSGDTETYGRCRYLGAGTIAAVEHPAVTGGLTLNHDVYGDNMFTAV